MTDLTLPIHRSVRPWRRSSRGLTLVELLIAVALGLVVTLALLAVFLNVSRTNTEMAKLNQQIESGRFTIQILEQDLQHAGFWGGYIPTFDNLMFDGTPLDTPDAVPDPCLAYGSWTDTHRANLVGVPVSIHSSAPGTCSGLLANHKAGTDILVVRHADTCATGDAGCEAAVGGKVYFQSSFCAANAQDGTSNSIRLAPSATNIVPDLANPVVLRILNSADTDLIGEIRPITTFNDSTKVATVTPSWAVAPDSSTVYTFGATDYVLANTGLNLRNRSCNAPAPLRAFVSHIYYVRTHSVTPGDGIPTLVRARLHVSGSPATPAYVVEPLIEGVEDLRLELGIDNLSKTGAAVELDTEIDWADPDTREDPTNRGNGVADTVCTTASGCTVEDFANAVHAKLFVLARTIEQTPTTPDLKTYCLGTRNAAGNCPTGYEVSFSGNDARFTRHVYSTMVRFHNISGRRDTP